MVEVHVRVLTQAGSGAHVRITRRCGFVFFSNLRRADPCAQILSFRVVVWRNVHEPSFARDERLDPQPKLDEIVPARLLEFTQS